MMQRLRNLAATGGHWSFELRSLTVDRRAIYPGEHVQLRAEVMNDGSDVGTVYVRFLVAESFDTSVILFDSDASMSTEERHSLRLVDIEPNCTRVAICSYTVQDRQPPYHFDVRAEVWTPRQLFVPGTGLLFSSCNWIGGFELIPPPPSGTPSVFISYSWSPAGNQKWVKELVEELRKHGIAATADWNDLKPGYEATAFMERGISESDVTLLICNEAYTTKANERQPNGVGYEAILSSHEYMIRTPEDRRRFIPIVRDNQLPTGRKLPRFLGSSIYVDMSSSDWREDPMQMLIAAIRATPKK